MEKNTLAFPKFQHTLIKKKKSEPVWPMWRDKSLKDHSFLVSTTLSTGKNHLLN